MLLQYPPTDCISGIRSMHEATKHI
jgi:hypothetical protein